MTDINPALLEQLLLPAHPPLADSARLQAAVLLLISGGRQPMTFLTVRSSALSSHAGQISLPGGKVDAGDSSYEATALREAHEETGVNAASVMLLGRLPQVVVSSGVEITPVVGWTELYPHLTPDPHEVAEIIECPLRVITDLGAYRRDVLEKDGRRREFWYIEINRHYVWGATASILRSLAATLARSG